MQSLRFQGFFYTMVVLELFRCNYTLGFKMSRLTVQKKFSATNLNVERIASGTSFIATNTDASSIISAPQSNANNDGPGNLMDFLLSWRKESSSRLGVSLTKILSLKAIKTICDCKPSTLAALSTIAETTHLTPESRQEIINIINQHMIAKSPSELTGFAELVSSSKQKIKPKKIVQHKEEDSIEDINVRIGLDELNSEQQFAASRAIEGQNVFITGAAGTGKVYI